MIVTKRYTRSSKGSSGTSVFGPVVAPQLISSEGWNGSKIIIKGCQQKINQNLTCKIDCFTFNTFFKSKPMYSICLEEY